MSYRYNFPTDHTLYVDSVRGNDATAIPYDSFRPYRTIQAALSASLSFPGNIEVLPGPYDLGGISLFRPGLIYYFHPGATVSSFGHIFDTSSGGPGTCQVFGNASFVALFASVVFMSQGATGRALHLECDTIDSFGSFINTIEVYDGDLTVKCNRLTGDHTFGATVRFDSGQAMANVTIESNIIDVTGFFAETLRFINNFMGNVIINCEQLLGSPNVAASFGISTVHADWIAPQESYVYITANEIRYQSGLVETSVDATGTIGFVGSGNVKFYINADVIHCPTMYGITVYNGFWDGEPHPSAELHINADIIGREKPVFQANLFSYNPFGGTNTYLNGRMVSDNDLAAITLFTGHPAIIELNGRLENKNPSGAGIFFNNPSPIVVANNLRIVTNGGASLLAPDNDNPAVVRSQFQLAMNSNPVNVSNSVVGSGFFVDTNII